MVDLVVIGIYNNTMVMNKVDKLKYKNIMNTVDKTNTRRNT